MVVVSTGCPNSLLFSCQILSSSSWTGAPQAPLSMEFSKQEYWSGMPFPSPGDLPNPGIEPMSPALAGGFCTTEPLSNLLSSDFGSFRSKEAS